jgi:hypothetical protein
MEENFGEEDIGNADGVWMVLPSGVAKVFMVLGAIGKRKEGRWSSHKEYKPFAEVHR